MKSNEFINEDGSVGASVAGGVTGFATPIGTVVRRSNRKKKKPVEEAQGQLDWAVRRHMIKRLAWESDLTVAELEQLNEQALVDLFTEYAPDDQRVFPKEEPTTLKSTMESMEKSHSWDDYGMPTAEKEPKKKERRLHSWLEYWEQEKEKEKKDQKPEPNLKEDISGVNDLIKQGVNLIDLPIYTFVGRDVKTGQTSKIVDLDSRPVVLIDIKGLHMPFYCSTGEGGKKNVPAGKWYPYWGNGQGGWFNKTSEEQINSFYGSSVLKSYAELLNNTIGNVVGAKLPELDIGKGKTIINRDMLSPQNSSELDKDAPNRVENWKRYKQRINTILKKIGSEPLFKDVTGEPELPKKPDAKPAPTSPSPTSPSPSAPTPAGGLIKNQLVLAHNGKTVTTMNISGSIGKQHLKSLGDDSKFWSDEQFKIEKNKDGTWKLVPNMSAVNKTMINGAAVTMPTPLKQGMIISVGNPAKKVEKLPLTVKQGVSEDVEDLSEAPINFDRDEPTNPEIYGHKANRADLNTRRLRALGQLKDMAQRAESAQEYDSLLMWKTIVANFPELAMNIGEIEHAIKELEAVRRKGGINSRGLPDLS